MKVLHISTRYPPGPGGVEHHVREVVVHLRARGVDACVLTSNLFTEIPWVRLPENTVMEGTTADGVPIHRHRALTLPGDLHYPLIQGLFLDILRERPDIVHIHTFGTSQGFSAVLARALKDIPYVMTAHYHPAWSMWGGAKRKWLRRQYDRYLAGLVLHRASALILLTPDEERLMRQIVPSLPPVRYISIGITPVQDGVSNEESFRNKYGIDGPYLLFVGRLASNKGTGVLLDAFAKLSREFPALRLVYAGPDGGEEATLREDARKRGLAERVLFTGFIPDATTLSGAYAGACIFVLPSDYEAFGMVLIEAMAHGTPVVATRVGGVPYVVEDGKNGLLVPPQDPGALAAALRTLLNDPDKARAIGNYGKVVTAPRYTWEHVAGELEQLYTEIIKSRGDAM